MCETAGLDCRKRSSASPRIGWSQRWEDLLASMQAVRRRTSSPTTCRVENLQWYDKLMGPKSKVDDGWTAVVIPAISRPGQDAFRMLFFKCGRTALIGAVVTATMCHISLSRQLPSGATWRTCSWRGGQL
jgi:hypothetical protein